MESVILVDQQDNPVGSMPKMEAHVYGKLHRAFSIFIFNSRGELLLQQRALNKYHSGGKWTNTCCSHPRAGEETIHAAHRRLAEEMGMSCELTYGFNFIYKADVAEGLLEHEFDHVYFGFSDALPVIAKDEVSSYKYLDMISLNDDINQNPEHYTAWLKICFDRVQTYFKNLKK